MRKSIRQGYYSLSAVNMSNIFCEIVLDNTSVMVYYYHIIK
nr:MAG TPA: hypothetical protein [Caudoviricetes sp.]